MNNSSAPHVFSLIIYSEVLKAFEVVATVLPAPNSRGCPSKGTQGRAFGISNHEYSKPNVKLRQKPGYWIFLVGY
jgi:hypothetical protein